MAIMHSSFTWKHWIGLMVTSAAYFFPYKQLSSMAKPVYADNGELLDGGFDLSTGGGEVEDEKTRKKREKMEKKASRGKMIKTRTR
nr:unnamed protein product [Digitaria exilis]